MVNLRYLLVLGFLAPFNANAEKLIDPTKPEGYLAPVTQTEAQQKSVAVRKWVLNTTLVSPYQKIAMINGKRLQVGDEIHGAEVINIDHQKADLRLDGKVFTIKLYNSFISKVNPGSN